MESKKLRNNLTPLLVFAPLQSSTLHELHLQTRKEMIADLVQLDPFRIMPGRYHESFPEIKSCPLRYLNIVEFHQWLDKHKWELSNLN